MENISKISLYIKRFGAWGFLIIAVQLGYSKLRRLERFKLRPPGFRNPIYLRPGTSDGAVFHQVFIKGSYELLREYDLENPSYIIDAGANIGMSTLFFAKQYPNALVIAIEPDSSNVELLRENTKAYDNVVCLRAGLWSKNTHLAIDNPGARQWSFRVIEQEGASDSVPAVTVADLLEMYPTETIDIFKLDIEGAEKEVFSFNTENWLLKTKNIFIELHERYAPGCKEVFYETLRPYKYDESQQGENTVVKISSSKKNRSF